MTSIQQRNATYDDLVALPVNVVGELIDGDLIVSPRPAGPHSQAASTLGMDLGSPFQRGRGGPGGWWILDEPELHLAHNVLVPDVAGWHRQSMADVPADHRFTIRPDWLCEVLSPSTASFDRIRKMRLYAAAGIQHVWILDPLSRSLEVYRLNGPDWLRIQSFSAETSDTLCRVEPFEQIELELPAFWHS
ncbi:MAG: Uma2 family endonuclease [Clostridia bacterium]|nr:Uma2 family endonuclease [Deltaproteobacteria bacterium]